MIKISIAADFRKNNSIFAATISAAEKDSGITPRTPRANTAETSGHTALARHVKRSSRLAVIVAQESAEPFVTFDYSTSQPKTTAVSVASYFAIIRERAERFMLRSV